ncbi:MAG: GNAT family N-acetyltransferase [Hyphomicrobium sp.]|uniref:GNAT family N-acetyltransferase n=1 Tax=Hyphomicrobium sp. TaxID=82 RepID=UPI0013241B3F|nr:GNAT family N-acetyltransferase [Hyphomicrobium sp.]KAB2940924.1 MAG: N-acetyltransferase [Hyphomicrobium sp.]MBZ0211398.1 GNAT family N-acetyltransferase [Hyphomicrobium sp.]
MSVKGGEKRTTVANIVARIADIEPQAWDACANPDPSTFNPFIAHAFLTALEESGCVGERHTAWIPQHITVDDPCGGIAACAPCYAKLNSAGEYVFDHAWASAYEQAGGRYYPKLQIAVPFTPVPGRRLLVRPGPQAEHNERVLAAAAVELTRRLGASSVHATFLSRHEWESLGAQGFLKRTDQQFHWRNEGYATFEDFLAGLASRKRKAVRKERREALADGLVIEQLTGEDIKEKHWDAFFDFYMETGSRKWGHPYLNRRFFSLLGAAMPERCLLIMARRGPRYVAGALNLIGGDCLYGRYWGAVEHHPCLHFEVCYYQAIDYAIAHRIARVEAGAQGEHKLARGYLPTMTYSAHFITDPGFRRAVARYLESERLAVAENAAELTAYAPYRKGDQS